MAEIGKTEVGAVDANIVANLVQETLRQKGMILPLVTDYSRFAVKGAVNVEVPRRDTFAAADKTENTDLTAQEMTFSVDTIPLTKHKAVYAKLEDIARIQAVPDVEAEIIQDMAAELAFQLDKDLIDQIIATSAAAPDHRIQYANTPTDTLQQTDILEARRLLNVQNVPMNDRFMLIPPDQEKALLLLSDFVRAETYGSPAGLREGELGRIYGFTVIMWNDSATLEANESLFFHKSHVGYATQMASRFDRDRDVKALSDEFALSWLYGSIVLDSGKRGVLINDDGL